MLGTAFSHAQLGCWSRDAPAPPACALRSSSRTALFTNICRNDLYGARDSGCFAWLWGQDVCSFRDVEQRLATGNVWCATNPGAVAVQRAAPLGSCAVAVAAPAISQHKLCRTAPPRHAAGTR